MAAPARKGMPMATSATERLAAEVAHLATRQSDASSVLQSIQAELHHVGKTLDKLTAIAEKQNELSSKISSHSDAIGRVEKQMDGNKGELAAAISKLSDTLDRDRGDASKIADTVTGYRAQLRLLYIVSGIIGSLVVTLSTLAYTQVNAAILANTNQTKVLEAKSNTERTDDKLIVAELERRMARLEAQGDEVAP